LRIEQVRCHGLVGRVDGSRMPADLAHAASRREQRAGQLAADHAIGAEDRVHRCRVNRWTRAAEVRPQPILPNARRIFSGVTGCEFTVTPNGDSASLMALTTAPGAPAVPASPAPLAPSRELFVGDWTWLTKMSGISAAIGTR